MGYLEGTYKKVISLGPRDPADFTHVDGWVWSAHFGEDKGERFTQNITYRNLIWNWLYNQYSMRVIDKQGKVYPIRSAMGHAKVRVDSYTTPVFNILHWNGFGITNDVNLIPTADYFATLDLIRDPDLYIKMLALWPTSLNLSAFVYGFGLDPQAKGIQFMPIPGVTDCRRDYAIYVKRFGEVIMYRMLEDAFNILDITRTEDLPSVEQAHYFVMNNLLPRIPALVNQRYHFNHSGFHVFDPNSKEIKNLFSYIPESKDVERGVDVYDISLVSGLNYTKSPDIWQPNEDSVSGGWGGTDPGGRCSVYYTDAKGNIVATRSAREAILHEAEMALTIIKIQEAKLAARNVQLLDKEAHVLATEFSLDPYQNPFLVYDANLSANRGVPIFKNIAYNVTPDFEGKTPQYVESKYGPSVEQYAKVDALRYLHQRNLYTSTGAKVSQGELADTTGREGKSILPWIIGGVAAAGLASQVI